MINLHLHTNCSDGILEPIELLKKLEANGVRIASITDHDTVNVYDKLKGVNIEEYYTGKLIQGVEVKCIHKGLPIEILGINIDPEIIKSYLNSNKMKIITFQQYAYSKGIEVSKSLRLKYDEYALKPGEWAGSVLYDLLRKYYDHNVQILGANILSNASTFYRKTFCDKNSPFYVSEESLAITSEEVVNKIHEAGGLAFLAQPGQYKTINDKIAFIGDLFANTDIDGVECYYPIHSNEETVEYIDFCYKHKLLISGGSDYHGTENQNIIKQENIDLHELSWLNNLSIKKVA
ncbi:MAG: PHP domain-containing protein [Ignavibacteriales bacterium]